MCFCQFPLACFRGSAGKILKNQERASDRILSPTPEHIPFCAKYSDRRLFAPTAFTIHTSITAVYIPSCIKIYPFLRPYAYFRYTLSIQSHCRSPMQRSLRQYMSCRSPKWFHMITGDLPPDERSQIKKIQPKTLT